jgi:hypothetical protein
MHTEQQSTVEAFLAGSVLLLVPDVAMGAVAIWDPGGLATTVRRRLSAMPVLGALNSRTPSWAFRAFGVWCILCGIGQLMFIYAITHGT